MFPTHTHLTAHDPSILLPKARSSRQTGGMNAQPPVAVYSDENWLAILAQIPAAYEQLAHEHKVINVQWPNAKVKDAATLLRFILLHVGADLPLRQTVAVLAAAGGPSLAPVWLHKRMRRAQSYLATLVGLLIADVVEDATPETWAGYEMVSVDGSSISGPGADGTDVRLHCVLRLHDLRVRDVRVTSVHEGETLRTFSWEVGQLVIGDRGYANAPGIAWTVDQGADVLVRVNRGALPLVCPLNKPIDVLAWCRDVPAGSSFEREAVVVHVTGKGKGENRQERRVPGRLIAHHLSPDQARTARERVRREEGPGVNAEQLEAAAYVILFTTARADRLSTERCVEAYRLRWQVELQFKRWKSLCKFDKLPNYIDETMLSWVTAKLLLGLLLDRLASPADGESPTARPGARQAWKITSIVWPLMLAALLPVGLATALLLVPALSRRLDAFDSASTPRQVEGFRWRQDELDVYP